MQPPPSKRQRLEDKESMLGSLAKKPKPASEYEADEELLKHSQQAAKNVRLKSSLFLQKAITNKA
jgi:hypothetical protein